MTSHRLLHQSGRFVALVALACAGDTAQFTPQEDDQAMVAIESSWSDGSLTFSMCEDYAAEPPPPYEEPDYGRCGVAHVVRGHGRGYAHEVDTGGSCYGSCDAQVIAYVNGTVSSAGLAAPLVVRGTIILQRMVRNDDEYAFPYEVFLACEAEGQQACTVEGVLEEDGTLAIEVWVGADPPTGAPTIAATLTRTGTATCGLPPS